MNSEVRKVNKTLLVSWISIVTILLIAYCVEVVKGERTTAYIMAFAAVMFIPFLVVAYLFKKKPDDEKIGYYVIIGYSFMYAFVMYTGATVMVSMYILPLLCFLILYHNPVMIIFSFAIAMLINITSLVFKINSDVINVSNSKDIEILFSVILVSYVGGYFSSRLYNDIHKTNEEYADSLQDKNEDLEMTANIDALTGLRNRHNIEACIDKTFKLAKGHGADFSFLMCDIDNFKKVNDTYGHDCGDKILKNVASIIKGEIRSADTAFRWGGEEILVIINAKEHIAKAVAERCRKSIEESSVLYDGKEIKVTITIGGASYYQGATRDSMVNKADDNLYKGKKNGKNQVVM